MDDITTDWDILLERFCFNTNALANAIRDIVGLPKPSYNVGLIRLDLNNYRFNSYSRAVPALFSLPPSQVKAYQNKYPSLLSDVDLEITINSVLSMIKEDPSITASDIVALIAIEEPLDRLVKMIFKKAGGNSSYLKHIKG